MIEVDIWWKSLSKGSLARNVKAIMKMKNQEGSWIVGSKHGNVNCKW